MASGRFWAHVIHLLPNDESALRLIGTLLAEQNEAWQGRKVPRYG